MPEAAAGRRWRPGAWDALVSWLRSLSADDRDVLVYGMSAAFAGLTALTVSIPLYPREWGRLAVGPYAAGALIMAVVAHRRRRATAPIPDGDGQRAGVAGRPPGGIRRRAARCDGGPARPGGDVGDPRRRLPARPTRGPGGRARRHPGRPRPGSVPGGRLHDGHILIRQRAIPVYELYYPYLPGMVVFGFSSGSKVEARLTDARIQFLLFTVVVAPHRAQSRATVERRPDAVVPGVDGPAHGRARRSPPTGGDDMPVVALMLFGLVALQRRRTVLAGLALGAASTLKFTAWPFVFLALFAVIDRQRRRAVGRYVAAVAVLVVPVVFPVALHNPSAFVDNVIRFPLGLAGVASPAASALPDTFLVSAFPAIHRPYVVMVHGGRTAVLGRYLWRRPPKDAAAVATVTGWVMLVAILAAPPHGWAISCTRSTCSCGPGCSGGPRTRSTARPTPTLDGDGERVSCRRASRAPRRCRGWSRVAWSGRPPARSPSRSRRRCRVWPGSRSHPPRLGERTLVDDLPAGGDQHAPVGLDDLGLGELAGQATVRSN